MNNCANLDQLQAFMSERGWTKCQCSICQRTFFTKSPNTSENTCQWRNCAKDNQRFLSLPKRKRPLRINQVSESIHDHFKASGFEISSALNVASSVGQTELIVAGVQILDNVIHLGDQPKTDKIFVAQPCVRMQFQPQVSTGESISTSFVNICSEQMMATFAQHLAAIDCWLSALSKVGLYMDNINLVVRTSPKNWGTGDFESLELFFIYGGLELGDAAFFLVLQPNRPAIPVSDIGFGLERIVWAVNKTESYFDNFTPIISSGSRESIDAHRTLALLSLCGVKPSNKGPGLQLRRLIKPIIKGYSRPSTADLLAYFCAYWARFIEPNVPSAEAIRVVQLEAERQINLAICHEHKLPPPKDEATDTYLDRLVYNNGMNIHELRKAVRECTQ